MPPMALLNAISTAGDDARSESCPELTTAAHLLPAKRSKGVTIVAAAELAAPSKQNNVLRASGGRGPLAVSPATFAVD